MLETSAEQSSCVTPGCETGSAPEPLRQMAYFYEPYWRSNAAAAIKTLLLFFDGIALTVPEYLCRGPLLANPELMERLDDAGLVVRMCPERMIDRSAAESVARLGVEMLATVECGRRDRAVACQAISRTKLGGRVEPALTDIVIAELVHHGLAKASDDGAAVTLHPAVRAWVLVALPQVMRVSAERAGYALQPMTSHAPQLHALLEFVDLAPLPTAGHVVATDLEQVTVDLASVPLADVLAYRCEYGELHRTLVRKLRNVLRDLALLPSIERNGALLDRREELAGTADELRRIGRRTWRKPMASYALGVAGGAVPVSDPGVTAANGMSSFLGLNRKCDAGSVYSYSYFSEARHPLTREWSLLND